jgi:hypothetical protein
MSHNYSSTRILSMNYIADTISLNTALNYQLEN